MSQESEDLAVATGDQDLNSVLGKCFAILDAVQRQGAGRSMSLAELVRESGIRKASAHRVANELVRRRLLERVGGRYLMGPRAFELASVTPLSRHLQETARPIMADLYAATREVVHFGVLAGTEVLYLEKVAGSRSPNVPTSVGVKMPLHCTGLGKAILAFADDDTVRTVFAQPLPRRTERTIVVPSVLISELRDVHTQRIACEHEESVRGFCCIASPVHSRLDEPLGAISVTVPTSRFNPHTTGQLVKAAAAALSNRLFSGPSRRSWANGLVTN